MPRRSKFTPRSGLPTPRGGASQWCQMQAYRRAGFSWRVGGLVPFEFRNYYVGNPYVYGLPPAPPAYRYVYLGRNIALIAIDSGRIVRVIPNVYF